MKLPNDWSLKALSALVDAKRPISYGVVQTGDPVADGVPCVRVVDLASGKPDRDAMITTSQKISASYSRTVLAEGDVIIALRGEIGRAALVPKALDGANLTRGIALLACAPKKMDPRFMFQSLACQHVRREIMHGVNGTGLQEIPITNLRQVRLPVPPLPEQRKIADILTTWDEALAQLDTLIEAQERRKKALMQQLLTRASSKAGSKHARQRMGGVLERVTRRNSSLNDNVLTISAQGGLVSQKEYFNRSVAGADLSGYYLLHRGEFAYNRSYSKGYPYGALKRLDQFDSGVVSTLYLCFRIKEGAAVSPEYLVHYFEGGRLNSGLRCIAKEGARAHGLLNVTADEFFDLDIFLPSLPEQQKIAEILDTADQQLTLLRTQRTNLDQQKRGLMQRLLTGRLRVKL